MNIFDLIDFHAKTRPYDIALIHPRGTLTYANLRSVIADVSLKLRSRGIRPGSTVAIYVTDPFLHMALMLGLMLNGVRSVSAHPNYDAMPATLPVDTYLSDREQIPSCGNVQMVVVDDSWLSVGAQPLSFPKEKGFADSNAICRIFTSSGTTGVPKAIGHTSEGLQRMAMMRLSRDTDFMSGPAMSMMAVASIGGFNTVYHAFWAGVCLVMATDILQTLRAINLYRVRTLVASPVQVQGMVGMLQGRGTHFPSLCRLYVGGSVLPAPVALAARILLSQNITNTYGATEIAGGAFTATATLLASKPNAAGYMQPDVQLKLLDESGQEVQPGSEGIVHLRTPVMASGYIGDPQATAECFVDGWFRPGDLGVWNDDGVLLITGRLGEMINAGGVKVSPQLVDDFLLSQPGVKDAAAFAARLPGGVEQVWAAIVVDPQFDDESLRQAAIRKLNARAPVRLVRVSELPRNAMGKVMRHQLAQSIDQTPSMH